MDVGALLIQLVVQLQLIWELNMLGLGSSVDSEEGYAKGERYRERWNDHVDDYNAATNPI